MNGGAKKRLITVEQLLTMSSGLTEPICGLGGATATLVATLSQGFVIDEQVGSFQYVCTQKILAWIIYEKSGLTPMEFGLSSLFPALGVSAGEFTWPIDAGTLQNTETDLHMTPRHLAKLVLLFRQQGLAAPDGPRLLSTTFVQTAMRSHWSSPWYYSRAECSAFSAPSAQGYGYRFQLYNPDWTSLLNIGRSLDCRCLLIRDLISGKSPAKSSCSAGCRASSRRAARTREGGKDFFNKTGEPPRRLAAPRAAAR